MAACGQSHLIDCCDERSVPEVLVEAAEQADVLLAVLPGVAVQRVTSADGACEEAVKGLRALNPVAKLLPLHLNEVGEGREGAWRGRGSRGIEGGE